MAQIVSQTFVKGRRLDALTVEVHKDNLVAPAGVAFTVEGLTEELFGNAGFYFTFTYAGSNVVETMRVGNDLRENGFGYMLGPQVARTFDVPGQVHWTLVMRYKGETRPIVGDSFTVLDPDTEIPDLATFWVSPASNFPVGASNTYTTFDAALTAAKAYVGPVARIRLERGYEYGNEITAYRRLSGGSGANFYEGLQIDAYGAGELPILRLQQADSSSLSLWLTSMPSFKFWNVDYRGAWDAATESVTYGGDLKEGFRLSIYEPDKTCNVTIHKCKFDGHAIALYCGLETPGIYVISENYITNWQDIGIFGAPKTILAVVGNSIEQNVDALGGGEAKGTGHNQHGPLRFSDCFYAIIALNTFFSNAGWTEVAASASIMAMFAALTHVPAHQACERCYSSATPQARSSNYGNFFEGGFNNLSLEPSAGASRSINGWHRLISNTFVASANTIDHLSIGYGGVYGENNRFFYPQVDGEYGDGMRSFLRPYTQKGIAENGYSRIQMKNSLYVNWGANTNADLNVAGQFASEGYTNVADTGYVLYEPNAPVPDTSCMPIDLTVLCAPKYKGFRAERQPVLDETRATPAGTIVSGYLTASSPHLMTQSTDDAPELDFFGNARTGALTSPGPYHAVAA